MTNDNSNQQTDTGGPPDVKKELWQQVSYATKGEQEANAKKMEAEARKDNAEAAKQELENWKIKWRYRAEGGGVGFILGIIITLIVIFFF